MARPEKDGLEYFSHDVDMFEDTKIKFLKTKHGLLGYAVYNRLLEMIYRGQGYFVHFTDRDIILFADENKMDTSFCQQIIMDCLEENLFNKALYDEYKILTSRRIQKNYIRGCERRKNIFLVSEFILIDAESQKTKDSKLKIINVSINDIIVNNNPVNVNINSINEYISTQREKEREKERESKKKGKGKEIEIQNPDDLPLPLLGEEESESQADRILLENWNRSPKNNTERKGFESLINQYSYEKVSAAMMIATERSKPEDSVEFLGYVKGILDKGLSDFKVYTREELIALGNRTKTPNIFEGYIAVSLPDRSEFEPFYVSKKDQEKYNLTRWKPANKDEPSYSRQRETWGDSKPLTKTFALGGAV